MGRHPERVSGCNSCWSGAADAWHDTRYRGTQPVRQIGHRSASDTASSPPRCWQNMRSSSWSRKHWTPDDEKTARRISRDADTKHFAGSASHV